MIQLLLNKAGTGKTKKMLDMANTDILSIKGQLVYVSSSSKHMYDLHRNIRLISTSDFNISTPNSFYGFLCGMISENYDIEKIYIHGLGKIISDINEDIEVFFNQLDNISHKYNVNFIISLSSENDITYSKLSKYCTGNDFALA